MTRHIPHLTVRLAATKAEVAKAQALRYQVFVEEMRARGGPATDDGSRLEADGFDPHCEHLLLTDNLQGNAVIGTMRVMTEEGAQNAGRFASEGEFDLSRLRTSGRRLLEVGRTCLRPDHRGGEAMHRLWQALAGFVEERGIELLFGLASFPGQEPATIEQSLACLQLDHLAPEGLRPHSLTPVPIKTPALHLLDRRKAMLATPALVKAYLRLGGRVGEGAFLDKAFNCIDVCMVLDTATLPARARALYGRRQS